MSAPAVTSTKTPNLVQYNRLDIATSGTEGAWVYTQALGLTNLSRPMSYSDQDISVFEDGAYGADMWTQVKQTITGTFNDLAGTDPVQAVLEEQGLVRGGLVAFRYYNRKGTGSCIEGKATVKWEPQGGAATAVGTVNFTLQVIEFNVVANPLSSAAAPTVSAATPSAAVAGTWVEITGTHLDEGVTSVKFGSTEATQFLAVSATKLLAKMPAGSAGAANIVVTNSTGANSAFSYTRGA